MNDKPAYITLSSLWDRITEKEHQTYRDEFGPDRSAPTRLEAMHFGPNDWMEATFLKSVDGQIRLLDEMGNLFRHGRSDLSSLKEEVDLMLIEMPTNGKLDGYRIGPNGKSLRQYLPPQAMAAAKLWDPGPHSRSDKDEVLGEQIIVGEAWYSTFQTLPLCWSRQTYQVDLTAHDCLSEILKEFSPEQMLLETEPVDHFLGAVSGQVEKWRPFEGCYLGVDTSWADSAWRRSFRSARQEIQDKGGRPNKSRGAADAYFELYPQTHQDLVPRVYWDTVLSEIIEKTGENIGKSTLEDALKSDDRWPKPKK